jgi:hypothetical protein
VSLTDRFYARSQMLFAALLGEVFAVKHERHVHYYGICYRRFNAEACDHHHERRRFRRQEPTHDPE